MIEHMKTRGIKQETIDMIRFCGVDFESWLYGFEDTEKSVKGTVEAIVNHPLIPDDVNVSGFIIDSVTGELTRCSDSCASHGNFPCQRSSHQSRISAGG